MRRAEVMLRRQPCGVTPVAARVSPAPAPVSERLEQPPRVDVHAPRSQAVLEVVEHAPRQRPPTAGRRFCWDIVKARSSECLPATCCGQPMSLRRRHTRTNLRPTTAGRQEQSRRTHSADDWQGSARIAAWSSSHEGRSTRPLLAKSSTKRNRQGRRRLGDRGSEGTVYRQVPAVPDGLVAIQNVSRPTSVNRLGASPDTVEAFEVGRDHLAVVRSA
jgi:hypothetical protein